MAISEDKMRVAISMPKWVAAMVREEAKDMDLTVSQYITLTMVANSYTGDSRRADLAVEQLQAARDMAWGYGLSERQKRLAELD